MNEMFYLNMKLPELLCVEEWIGVEMKWIDDERVWARRFGSYISNHEEVLAHLASTMM